MLSQIIVNGLVTACVYGLIATGFSLIYNTTGVLHLAHGCVYTASAYALYAFYVLLQWSLPSSIVITIILATLLGVLIEKLVYYPLYKKKEASHTVVLISSLGVYIFVVNLIALSFGNLTQVLRPGVEETYKFGNIILTKIQLATAIISPLLFLFFFLFMRSSKMGRNFRALSSNPNLAIALGMNIPQIRVMALTLGSVLAGMGASLTALDVGIGPNIGLTAMFTAIVASIAGGKKIIEAAIPGAFLLGVIQSLVIWQFSAQWEQAVTFVVLILFLLFRPQGILGYKRRIEEL